MTDNNGGALEGDPGGGGAVAMHRPRRARSWLFAMLPVVPLLAAGGYALVSTSGSTAAVAPSTAPVELVDLSTVSTQRLETILDNVRNRPEAADDVPGIALVLAERHFTDSAYDRAFALYAEVIEHPRTTPPQFALSLSRVAWLAWLTNGDAGAALTTIDQSLSIDPDNAETYYIKGQILWCGADDRVAAIELFETVLEAPDLTAEVRAQVEGDLQAAMDGESCR